MGGRLGDPGSTRQHPIPAVIDTDTGIDDAVALALAVRSPELRVAAVTTTWGNAPLTWTTRNARHVLALAGAAGVPVFPGADRPMAKPASGVARRLRLPVPVPAGPGRDLSALAMWLADAMRFRHSGGCPLADVAGVAAAIHPGVLDFERRDLKIGGGGGVRLATEVDRMAVGALLVRVFGINPMPPSAGAS